MIHLTLTLCETITGCTTDDYTEEVTMEAQNSGGCASMEVGIESGTEIEVDVDGHRIEVSGDCLEGTDSERIQFAADITTSVVGALNRRNAHLEKKISELQAKLNESKATASEYASRAHGAAKLANVWGAVSEYLDEDLPHHADSYEQGYALAKARAKNALRDMGLEPEAEPDLDTAG